MTTPREHAELAARLERLETTIQAVCQYNGGYNSLEVQEAFYDVVHELQDLGIDTKPPPVKRTVTLTVNGREWVLPEPFRNEPEKGTTYWTDKPGGVFRYVWQGDVIDKTNFRDQRVHASESDAKAWAEFDKWCRGGRDE